MLLVAIGVGEARAQDPQYDGPSDNAFELSAAYTAEVWRNEGGVKDGWRYLDNLDVVLEADLERAVGWEGTAAALLGLDVLRSGVQAGKPAAAAAGGPRVGRMVLDFARGRLLIE